MRAALQERQGYVFETQTDTEVIAKLAKYVYDTQTEDNENNSFEAVVKAVVKELQGAYALIFKSSLFPNEIIATRRGSPLLLGIKSKDTPVDEKVEVTFSPAPTRKGKANARKKTRKIAKTREKRTRKGGFLTLNCGVVLGWGVGCAQARRTLRAPWPLDRSRPTTSRRRARSSTFWRRTRAP